MLSSSNLVLVSNDFEWLSQGNRLQILHFHFFGKSDDVAEFVHLTHGFVEDGGNDAAVRVSGRALISFGEFEFANSAPGFFITVKLELHPRGIVFSAGEAVILPDLGLRRNAVTVSGLTLLHEEARLYHRDRGADCSPAKRRSNKLSFSGQQFRHALLAKGLVIIQNPEHGK